MKKYLMVFIVLASIIFCSQPVYAKQASQVYVVFRYDEIGGQNKPLPTWDMVGKNGDVTDLEKQIFYQFTKRNLPFVVDVIPYMVNGDYHDPSSRDYVNLSKKKVALIKSLIKNHEVEVAQHGYSHQLRIKLLGGAQTEFVGMPYKEQLTKITKGKKYIEKTFGIKLSTFATPWSTHDQNTIDVVRKLGFKIIVGVKDYPYPSGTNDYTGIRRFGEPHHLGTAREDIRRQLDLPGNNLCTFVVHAMEFKESGHGRGNVTLKDLSRLLGWIKSQKNVKVVTYKYLIEKKIF